MTSSLSVWNDINGGDRMSCLSSWYAVGSNSTLGDMESSSGNSTPVPSGSRVTRRDAQEAPFNFGAVSLRSSPLTPRGINDTSILTPRTMGTTLRGMNTTYGMVTAPGSSHLTREVSGTMATRSTKVCSSHPATPRQHNFHHHKQQHTTRRNQRVTTSRRNASTTPRANGRPSARTTTTRCNRHPDVSPRGVKTSRRRDCFTTQSMQQHVASNNSGMTLEENKEAPVSLRVYDLSRGRASTWSKLLLGGQAEIGGIWHTAIQVYGDLYQFFGGAIVKSSPEEFDELEKITPVRIHSLGCTKVGKDTLLAFLESLASKFTYESYNITEWNCNHFTDEVCRFLLRRNIPQYIVDAPSRVKSALVGRIAVQLISRFNILSLSASSPSTDTCGGSAQSSMSS